tara:strand:- start:5089 stop:6243 length:1155 start_codon:yes stop_codon:yes gene_type:complete
MNLYYWAPFLSNVATVKAVLNSATGVKKYSKNIKPHIINAVGEWSVFEKNIKNKGINLISFKKGSSFYEKLPRYSFFKSRFSYLLISLVTFFKLYKFFKSKKENDFIILHLITSLPLLIILLFNFKCKFILRISGFPKLNFFRKLLWKLCNKKLYLVSTPTKDTKEMLVRNKIFSEKITFLLRDPIISISEINLKKKEKIEDFFDKNEFIVNAGRLTSQKNQKFLIDGFSLIKKKYSNLKLLILGDGELDNYLKFYAKKLNLENDIYFLGHKDNVFKYYKKSICFILTSRWEDPGFVLIEAAAAKTPIISSDCKNGPKEFINNEQRGYLFRNYDLKSFENKFSEFMNDKKKNKDKLNTKILHAFKEVKKFTNFSHLRDLLKIIN